MYFEKSKSKEKIKLYKYCLSRGLTDPSRSLDGDIVASMNILPDGDGIIAPRKSFYGKRVEGALSGLGCAGDKIYYTTGSGFYYDYELKGSVEPSRKEFVNFNRMILIFPDKKYYDADLGVYGDLEKSTGKINVKVGSSGDGTGKNTLCADGVDLCQYFGVGSGVYIEGNGLSSQGAHTVTAVDKASKTLIFEDGEFEGEGSVIECTLSNHVPDGYGVCVCGGRVWCCSGSKIFASAYGDPFNWCAYDGGEMSSFTVDTGDFDGFTYCAECGGYPVFFTRNKIYKMYGDDPSSFSLRCVSAYGGISDIDRFSPALLGDEIFYMSHGTVMCFSGNEPQKVPGFPTDNVTYSIGGSSGDRYYSVVRLNDATKRLLVYDKEGQVWSELKNTSLDHFICVGKILYASGMGFIYIIEEDGAIPDGFSKSITIISELIFDDPEMSQEKKYPLRIFSDIGVGDGSEVKFFVMYDRDGEWREVGSVSGQYSGMLSIELVPRGCYFWKIRLVGTGEYRLKGLAMGYCSEG